ncbi:DNA-binding transcriptional regulator, MerR family [Paenibacillus sophorae]|uniref:DNA-binding transcriptional regulator, MerR family n=1 Tax=Paenibacillus sophorae TaxID=1333845 RepID=A0A1H8QXQ3_9BACL|nr:MerR family transcriptional regulator [Paenibacillus sophorae]QWU14881.1 MerR family transcriptional regulator [Paenibacillus sophorae]SEO59120.1 DNA-binding transcriptional regulator, MerR family [Paenibacillus sophorae]
MNSYTAKQIADILQQDDPRMNLRTVRYYTQIGMIPPLELVGNKRVYTDNHIHYFRAIITLSRTGETLASIQETLKKLSLEDIEKISQQMALFEPSRIIENETLKITDDVIITISPRISAELKQRVIDSVSQALRGEKQ